MWVTNLPRIVPRDALLYPATMPAPRPALVVPAIFIYMASDCIKRRSTQSATGILYVAGVLVFIGEMIALYLVRVTGLPF